MWPTHMKNRRHDCDQKGQHDTNGAHSATTEPAHCTPEMGGSSKASTADLTLAVSSDHDDGLPELLTYDSVVS